MLEMCSGSAAALAMCANLSFTLSAPQNAVSVHLKGLGNRDAYPFAAHFDFAFHTQKYGTPYGWSQRTAGCCRECSPCYDKYDGSYQCQRYQRFTQHLLFL